MAWRRGLTDKMFDVNEDKLAIEPGYWISMRGTTTTATKESIMAMLQNLLEGI